MRIVFAGTPEFARVALARIHAAGFEIALVMSQPDRPAGRGLKLVPSPLKAFALEHGIAVAQPRSLRLDGRFAEDARAARDALAGASPDAMVVAGLDRALDRRGAAPARQQRAVQVETAQTRGGERLRRQDQAIGGHDRNIRM